MKAAVGHRDKREVRDMLANQDTYASEVLDSINSGEYVGRLKYRDLVISSSGKKRNIKAPTLYTRVLQVMFNQMILPYYNSHDTGDALNCKIGCGITANNRKKSILHRLKHIMYDRRDVDYALVMDQRKCYDHITKGVFRRKLERITSDEWLIQFGVNVVFTPEGRFPIGTPTSPLAHHIVMLDFDKMIHSLAPLYLRYADNIILFSSSKSDLQQAKWRIQNWWWYDLGIRAKRQNTRVFPLADKSGLDFCGYRVFRNEGRGVTDHDKGYTLIRKSTAEKTLHCPDKSVPSYFGLLKHADSRNLIEKSDNMKLKELNKLVKIDRQMDARKIEVKELADNKTVFNIIDHEIRYDNKEKKPNWIKCLIGIKEESSGRYLAREFHGNYQNIIESVISWEQMKGKENILPIEDVTIENSCGYIFVGSTNQITYIDELT